MSLERLPLYVLAVLVTAAVVYVGAALWQNWPVTRMPGESHRGPLDALTPREAAMRDALRRDVGVLAGEIGERNVVRYQGLRAAEAYVERSFAAAGYAVRRQEYAVGTVVCANLEVEIPGAARADEIVVVGAHYDSVVGCPGANDNGSGTAALLELARAFAGAKPARTLRFVAFVNEEPPHFQTEAMGSLVYARACRERGERVVAMLSLETIGYYSDDPGSQNYPFPLGVFYPSEGNFIGFVGNTQSQALVFETIASFRRHARFPSEGGVLDESLPGIGWSDHWSFWQAGYPAVEITDTAPFRYAHYHTAADTPEQLDYDRLARVVAGLEGVVGDLVSREGAK